MMVVVRSSSVVVVAPLDLVGSIHRHRRHRHHHNTDYMGRHLGVWVVGRRAVDLGCNRVVAVVVDLDYSSLDGEKTWSSNGCLSPLSVVPLFAR